MFRDDISTDFDELKRILALIRVQVVSAIDRGQLLGIYSLQVGVSGFLTEITECCSK